MDINDPTSTGPTDAGILAMASARTEVLAGAPGAPAGVRARGGPVIDGQPPQPATPPRDEIAQLVDDSHQLVHRATSPGGLDS
jgi:hypothetical protein